MEKLFVYGSLKKGRGLSSYLDMGLFLENVKTGPEFTLIAGRHFPYLVPRKGLGAVGELYEIPKELIPVLDSIEGHPNFYERKKIMTFNKNGDTIETWAYVHPDVFDKSHPVIEEW